MRPATSPVQRPPDARLLVLGDDGRLVHASRAQLPRFLAPDDLLVANDAATLPASLTGTHLPTGAEVEVRLAGRRSLAGADIRVVVAVVFGAGDHRIRTEHRPLPPRMRPGDELHLGPLAATVLAVLGHPRLVSLRFAAPPQDVWAGLARHGRPVQYAHLTEPLALWDVWTRIAALPAALEPPSAGFLLDWRLLADLRRRGVGFATLTHAAGLSSTGDPGLDARLPLDEPYRLPAATVEAVARTRRAGGRVVALGTSVARALEDAAATHGELRPGPGLATLRIGPQSELRVVDALVTGVHQPGESHYELLRAFADDDILALLTEELERHGYRSHEFGDSVLVARWGIGPRPGLGAPTSPHERSTSGKRPGA